MAFHQETGYSELIGDSGGTAGHRWDTGWDGTKQREQDRNVKERGKDETARNQTNGTGLKRY